MAANYLTDMHIMPFRHEMMTVSHNEYWNAASEMASNYAIIKVVALRKPTCQFLIRIYSQLENTLIKAYIFSAIISVLD